MESDIIAAAILTAAYVQSQRQPLTLGVLDGAVREQFVEYLEFVREHRKPAGPAAGKKARTATR
jgi:hypothetical protein